MIYLRTLIPKLRKVDKIFIAGDIVGTLSYPLILRSIIRNRKISRERYADDVYGRYLKQFSKFQISSAKQFLKIISKLETPTFFTHGNIEIAEIRDFYTTESEKYDNIFYLGNELHVFDKWVIAGYGFCSPADYRTPFQTPGERSTEEIKQNLAELEKNVMKFSNEEGYITVGLFHEPPLETKLDYIPYKSSHGGSKEIREHISKTVYNYVFTGHIHESPNYEISEDTILINPGSLVNRRWALLDHNERIVMLNKIRIPLSVKGLIYNTRSVYE
jgi:Icc-related predicted phosphoesterase